MKARLAITVLGLLLASHAITAHHSFAAEFDETKPVLLKGILTKMEWVNPHGWIYLDVKGPDGKVVNWGVEAGAPNALIRRGLRKEDFTIGSEVVVQGYRARSGEPIANGRSVTFANGKNFFMGSSGTGAPKDGTEDEKPKGRGGF
jgi:hypothetical protein